MIEKIDPSLLAKMTYNDESSYLLEMDDFDVDIYLSKLKIKIKMKEMLKKHCE